MQDVTTNEMNRGKRLEAIQPAKDSAKNVVRKHDPLISSHAQLITKDSA